MATDCDGDRQITLIASGSEISIAITAQTILAGEGISAAVVSVPCLDLFPMQDANYRNNILGKAPRIYLMKPASSNAGIGYLAMMMFLLA